MCNACGFHCCAWDGFEKCGCEDCWCEDCWDDEDEELYDDDFGDSTVKHATALTRADQPKENADG